MTDDIAARPTRLADLIPDTVIRGVLPNGLVTVTSVKWYGSECVEIVYKDAKGQVDNQIVYRDQMAELEIVDEGRPFCPIC